MKVFGALFVQYDQLTLICEQSELKFKYRQLLPPVVQALVQPFEPLAREKEGGLETGASEHSLGAQTPGRMQRIRDSCHSLLGTFSLPRMGVG